MDKRQIQKVNDWFDNKTEYRSYFTNRNDTEYSITESDIEEFADFLTEEFPDLIGIECMVGKGGIWFWKDSLEKASFL